MPARPSREQIERCSESLAVFFKHEMRVGIVRNVAGLSPSQRGIASRNNSRPPELGLRFGDFSDIHFDAYDPQGFRVEFSMLRIGLLGR